MAIDFLEKSLDVKEKAGFKNGVGTTLNNLGYTYYEMGDIDKALSYFQQAYDLYLKLGEKKSSSTRVDRNLQRRVFSHFC